MSCLVGEVWVVLGRQGLGFAFWLAWVTAWVFFFFFFNMSFWFDGILVGNGQCWRGGHGGGAVVVTGQWW